MKKGYWTDIFSYVHGVVRYKDLAYFSLVSDEVAKRNLSQSIFTEWDAGTWRGSQKEMTRDNWNNVGITIAIKPLEQAVYLGATGEIFCIGSGDIHDENIASSGSSPSTRGPLRGIKTIGKCVYVVGMHRQVYRRDQTGKWTCIDKGASPEGKQKVVGFEAIDGFDEKDIYAVGWDGEIWRYDGKNWSQKKSPSKLILTGVCCSEDGNVYICGQNGTLIRGRNDKWDLIKSDRMTDNIWSVCWYNDSLYLSTMRGVYVLKKDSLALVDMGKDHPKSFYSLSAADGVLWSIGPKDVMAFDGKKWIRID